MHYYSIIQNNTVQWEMRKQCNNKLILLWFVLISSKIVPAGRGQSRKSLMIIIINNCCPHILIYG